MLVYTSPPEDFQSTMETVGFFWVHNNKILHLLRQDHKPDGDKRAGPGGKMDSEDVSPVAAMQRELKEETKIEINANDFEFLKTYYVRYPERDFIYHKYRYIFSEKPDVTIDSKEHKDFDWFTPEEALEHELLLWEDEVIRDIYNIT